MKMIKMTILTLAVILVAVSIVEASEICVAREEDNGVINIIPAWIAIDGRSAFALIGGERKCKKVDPGKHTVVASSQNPYDPNDKNQKTWVSQPLKVTLPKRGKVEISAAPINRGPEYVGPWELKGIGGKHRGRVSTRYKGLQITFTT